jgi:RNA polymerase sigma-70 factor (ECF subfamily)
MARSEEFAPMTERFETLFREHYAPVAQYVARRAPKTLADDVVAETFLVAWRRLDDVPSEALPWLLATARRTLSTHLRGAQRRQRLNERLALEPKILSAVDDSGVTSKLAERVSGALARLSEGDREAIQLIAWEGLTPREAAAVLGEPPATFRVRLHRAKRRLRKLLEPNPVIETKSALDVHAAVKEAASQ